ncbi:MAG: B12-binding domain-containing radical SAM protein [Candidatus Zixiibacteriota bacterium]|nr:MAG: B12-binding domain-containing radical SAM protein [candidate division Zixibacteria bacterium]
MKDCKTPSILIAYPSCFHYPVWMERLEVKTSQLLLASYLAQCCSVTYADFEVSIGRPNTPTQIRRYERRVRDYFSSNDVDILALSCWTSLSYQATITSARIFRELYPDRLIVVGGYHPSARPSDFISTDNLIDYVICGEGELALQTIAESYRSSGRPTQTEIVPGPPFTARHFVGYNWPLVDSFIREHFPDGLGNIYMYLSRGCPFGCSFCMEPLKDRHWRAFSPQDAVREMHAAVKRYGAYAVAISDACFGMRPAWRREFLQRLVASDPQFWVVFETRPEYVNPDDILLLAKLKLEIQFGIESGSPEMLLLMKKTRQPEKFLARFRDVSHLLSDHGILHRANMILNHPGETRKTLEKTFELIDTELERRESYLMWACHGYMHFPGCELDTNRKYYEETFGSRYLSPEWWKDDEDQYENSQRFVPSRDLDGANVDLWKRMHAEREQRMKDTLAPRAFRFAANKYFLDWRDDPRYRQSKTTMDVS